MTARDLPPWGHCRGQLRLPLAPELPADPGPDPIDVAAVFADLERLEIDMTQFDTDDDGGDQ